MLEISWPFNMWLRWKKKFGGPQSQARMFKTLDTRLPRETNPSNGLSLKLLMARLESHSTIATPHIEHLSMPCSSFNTSHAVQHIHGIYDGLWIFDSGASESYE